MDLQPPVQAERDLVDIREQRADVPPRASGACAHFRGPEGSNYLLHTEPGMDRRKLGLGEQARPEVGSGSCPNSPEQTFSECLGLAKGMSTAGSISGIGLFLRERTTLMRRAPSAGPHMTTDLLCAEPGGSGSPWGLGQCAGKVLGAEGWGRCEDCSATGLASFHLHRHTGPQTHS